MGFLKKSESTRKMLQVVVQHVPAEPRFPWHLIAYGGGRRYLPRKFHSLGGLLQALRAVLPDLNESRFSVRTDAVESRIVYTETMTLDNAQWSALLGLSDDTPSKP